MIGSSCCHDRRRPDHVSRGDNVSIVSDYLLQQRWKSDWSSTFLYSIMEGDLHDNSFNNFIDRTLFNYQARRGDAETLAEEDDNKQLIEKYARIPEYELDIESHTCDSSTTRSRHSHNDQVGYCLLPTGLYSRLSPVTINQSKTHVTILVKGTKKECQC